MKEYDMMIAANKQYHEANDQELQSILIIKVIQDMAGGEVGD